MKPEIVKIMADTYAKMMGKPLGDYNQLNRADCMAFGKRS